MGVDDLLGDREAEAGVLAKALMRTVGVEALEDALQRVVANARTVIVDHDLDLGAHAAAGDAHLAAGLGERLRVGEQVGDHLSEPRIVAGHRERVGRAAALETRLDRDVMAELGFVGDGGRASSAGGAGRPAHVLALQFGIEAAGVGDVGDQAVEPLDVMLDHLEQARAAVLVARQRQRLDR